MHIPNFIMQIQGMEYEGKKIIRVISMNTDTDDVTVSVDDKDRGYKLILTLPRILNLLGYYNEPITKILEKKAEEKEKRENGDA